MKPRDTSKDRVRQYWQTDPCGSKDATQAEGTAEFFEEVERQRFDGDDFMLDIVPFRSFAGRDVLEVGCGIGTDLLQFARGGAVVSAIDLTQRAVGLSRRRLELYGYGGHLAVGDAEQLPIRSDRFDLVYSWGVIHHTPDPAAAAREIVRVCRPGGTVLVMVYHRWSLFALQAWIVFGLLKGQPQRRLSQVIGEHVESAGTKAYTRREAAALFRDLEDVRVSPILTRWDARVGRRRFLPGWMRRIVPSRLGWFLVIRGTKPDETSMRLRDPGTWDG